MQAASEIPHGDPFEDFNREMIALAGEVSGLVEPQPRDGEVVGIPTTVTFTSRGDDIELSLGGNSSGLPEFCCLTGPTAYMLLSESPDYIKVEAMPHIQTLVQNLLTRKVRYHEIAKGHTEAVRAFRKSLFEKGGPTAPVVTQEEAQELTAEYVHNLRVRYEGLLDALRTENDRLHKCVDEVATRNCDETEEYETMFNLCKSLFALPRVPSIP